MSGLEVNGYTVYHGFPNDALQPGDLLLTWNRIGAGDSWAKRFTKRHLPVIVIENSTWGNDFLGGRWYHLARTYHNTADRFPYGGPERFDEMAIAAGYEFGEWRTEGETVILPQRGIGSDPVKMPASFLRKVQKKHPGRVRRHPGQKTATPLEIDLANAGRVVTWGSGAAIKALAMGIPVTSYMPNWIGEQDNTQSGRLSMFRRLAWAQWTIEEIAEGVPFSRLIGFPA